MPTTYFSQKVQGESLEGILKALFHTKFSSALENYGALIFFGVCVPFGASRLETFY